MGPLKVSVGILLFIAFCGFGISTGKVAPSYAVAYLDDVEETYISLPCVNEWESRPAAKTHLVRQATIGEAHKAGYKPDRICRDNGGFAEDGRSLIGLLLEWVGLLPPLKYWWDAPYRTESGELVDPIARR